MATLGILLIAAIALFIAWYSLSLRHKRKKAKEILRWIQSSLAGRGHVVGISWISPSRLRVPLRLTCGLFQRAWVLDAMRELAGSAVFSYGRVATNRLTVCSEQRSLCS